MARLFPLRSETSTGNNQPRVVDVADEDADAVFSALSSTTAREIYAALDERPRTPSDVAEAIDSSIQNVRYHLEKLEGAGLIEVVDTWYSSRGNEMNVYATTNGPLIVTSDRSTADRLKDALSRYLGGVVALAGASLFVQYGLERFFGPDVGAGGGPADDADDGGTADDADSSGTEDGPPTDDGGRDSGTDGDSAAGEAGGSSDDATSPDSTGGTDDIESGGNELSREGVDNGTVSPDEGNDTDGDGGSADSGSGDAVDVDSGAVDGSEVTDGGTELAEAVFAAVPPGMLFFLGGLLVLTAVTVYWYWRTY